MATYLMLFSFTQQGIAKIKESPARIAAAKDAIHRMGGEVLSFYAILGGESDTFFLVRAPSDETVAAMALAVAALGNVRTRTHRVFDEKEFATIAGALP